MSILRVMLLVIFTLALCLPSLATTKSSIPLVIPTPNWLSPAAPAQKQVLNNLTAKSKEPPYDAILSLLTVAQSRFSKPTVANKRAGIDAAYGAALLAETRANDPALTVHIFEGFLLPFLSAAHPEAAYQTSRQSLLKAAFTAYQQNQQLGKEIGTLTLLRYWAADDNTHDWACVQLVPLFVARQNYAQAIAATRAIRSPEMRGCDTYLPTLEQKLKDQLVKQSQAKGPNQH